MSSFLVFLWLYILRVTVKVVILHFQGTKRWPPTSPGELGHGPTYVPPTELLLELVLCLRCPSIAISSAISASISASSLASCKSRYTFLYYHILEQGFMSKVCRTQMSLHQIHIRHLEIHNNWIYITECCTLSIFFPDI